MSEGPLRHDGRVVIVTGAGRGLGRAFALELARRGATVVVNDSGVAVDGTEADPSVAAAVAAEIGGDSVADPRSADSEPEHIVGGALARFGRIDALVLNAGLTRERPIDEEGADEIASLFATNLVGPIELVRHAWPSLRAAGHGRILLVSSGAALFGVRDRPIYAASKGGLVGLSAALAVDGRRHGITSNVLLPVAATRMARSTDPPPPAAVAPLAAWLVHPDCTATGTMWSSSGGRMCRVAVGLTQPIDDPELTAESAAAIGEQLLGEPAREPRSRSDFDALRPPSP